MSAMISTISEAIPTGFEHTPLAYAAAGIAVAGVAVDFVKNRLEAQEMNEGLPLADPEMNQEIEHATRWSARREKLGHLAAVGFFAFGTFHLAHPTNERNVTRGDASIVIDASYASSVEDMKSTSGSETTRFTASLEGSVDAASDNHVPFSFVLEGNGAKVVARTPANGIDIAQTKNQLNGALNPYFQNGEALGSGVEQAVPLAGADPNKIVVIASNVNAADTQKLETLETTLKSEHSTADIYAVVVGSGAGHFNVATDQLSSPVDTASFVKILGADHVQTAQSSDEVTNDINRIISTTLEQKTKEPINLYLDIALGFAALSGLLAVGRRASGITNRLRRLRRN